MSMILRDFDLPKAGEVLILKIYPDRGVVVSPGTECEARDNIVVPIPKRHGRLIDGDELLKRIEKSPTFASKYKETAKLFIRVYTEQGTILEAENL